jgi:DNA polymerase elongation subunit (family B)
MAVKPHSPRILTIDIETATIEAHVWGCWDQNVGLEQIKTEWSILSYCAKWLGSSRLYYDDTSGRGKNRIRDDKKLMKGLWKLLDEADIVVAQNGKKFDIPKINARLVEHGFKPYSPVRIVDTLQLAKARFGFTSNKLEWMSQHLTTTPKSKHKEFPGFELWKECLEDNPRAWAEMKKYNCRDVVATELVYLKLRAWDAKHPNVGTYAESVGAECPKCGSGELQMRGTAMTQQGKYPRFQCRGCGGWSRGKALLIERDQRKRLLANIQ